jgi:NADPH-dependent 2,4-dienoyl-CoA reductase/sulfur reductase-like enzyme
MSTKNVLVLGGNFAGLTAALSLKHELGDGVDITVVAKSDRFQFNPSFIWIPFGRRKVKDVVFPVAKTFTSHGVKFVHGEATTIDPAAQQVQTTQGPLGFDYLVIATGYLNNFEVVPGPVRRLRGRSDGTPGRAAPRHHRVHPRAGLLAAGSDRLAVAEELVVLVVAAVAAADL